MPAKKTIFQKISDDTGWAKTERAWHDWFGRCSSRHRSLSLCLVRPMHPLLLLSFVTPASTLRAASTLEVPLQNRVILNSGHWTPTQTQTEAAYRSVQGFLQKPVVSEPYYLGQIAEILKHRKPYRVQFIGRYDKGRKIILCSFFPIRLPEDKQDYEPGWRRHLVEVMDGGFWYWRIKYDPQTDRCSDFDVNGYA